MASEDVSILKGVLTPEQPLGPIDQALIAEDDVAKRLLNEELTPFKRASSNPYMLLLGPAGSGMSAILDEIRLNLQPSLGDMQNDVRLPKKGEPFIIPVRSWQIFYQIRRDIMTQYKADNPSSDLIPSERYTKERCYKVLWDETINHFFDYAHPSTLKAKFSNRPAKAALKPVRNYVKADTNFQRSAEREAKRLFDAARRSILDFLKQRKSKLCFLFDSMDEYPVRNDVFPRVLTGLFRALNSINAESQYIQISFCISEEIESILADTPASPLQYFNSFYRIRWAPIELLRIVAHRFRLSMAIHDEEFHKKIKDLDFSRPDHICQLFRWILPKSVNNAFGDPEDPLAYIIRHTQLLPRHVLAIFNAILSGSFSSGKFKMVDESAIRLGIADVERIIALQIRHPYNDLYPKLFAACKEILPCLNPICSFSALEAVEGEFEGRIEPDVVSVWLTLFEMGVLGRVVEPVGDGSLPAWHSGSYHYGDFHFNSGTFDLVTGNEYCFHPVFSQAFRIPRQKGDKRVVYPANIEMVTLAS